MSEQKDTKDTKQDVKSEQSVNQSEQKTDQQNQKEDIKDATSGKINVSIEPDDPKNFTTSLKQIRDKADNLSRMSEQGIVNEITGSAVVVRKDGQINMTPSKYASVHMNPNGRITEQAMEKETIANRQKFTVDEILVNEHKLNPQLWELADMRAQKLLINQNVIVGNLTLSGHVLVKAWEPNLKRYMLIRRPWRGPMFGPLLNVPEINTAIKINDPLKLNEDILALSDKGYQVNGIIKDAKSLIGKEGIDRAGSVARNTDANYGTGTGLPNAGKGSLNTNISISSGDMQSLWSALKQMGFNDIAAAGLLGCFSGESSGRFDALEGDYLDEAESQQVKQSKDRSKYAQWAMSHLSKFVNANPSGYDGGDGLGPMPGIGLAQWTGPRAVRLFTISNGEWWTPQAQIKFATEELNGGYASVFNSAQGCGTPEEAARVFAVEYEGGGFSGYADDRASRAREIYTQFAGKSSSDNSKPKS